LQISYDHSYRDELYGAPTLNIRDLDFQHRIALSDRNSFLWGLGYRLTNLEFESPSGAHPFPSGVRRDNLYQAFFEDQLSSFPTS
jgi:hypothetical protein